MRAIDADKVDFKEVFIGESDFAKDTREAAQKLIDKQPTIDPVKQEWISVKGRLPESDIEKNSRIETEKVIAYDGNRILFGNFTIYKYDNSFEFYGEDTEGTYSVWKVTHWMPLPEPPERDGE